ncbi:MAG TPA: HAMP domain-containing sensor histidine kinase [Nitrososphaeraceae archaeon]|nr:HAMP domain-containing sensor histidine kinase [Nitrososphaeraceae archaeon]
MLNIQKGLTRQNKTEDRTEKKGHYRNGNKSTLIPSASIQIDDLIKRSHKIRLETEIIINTASSRSTSNKENQDHISTPKVSNEQKAKRFGSKDDEGKYYEKNTISKECLETVKVDPKLLTAIQNLRDINDELVKSLQNLNGKFERQKEFINIAAHELRSPTQAITGYVELLNLEPGNSKRYQNLIVKNAETLNILVLNILDTSRIDNQTLNLKKENFDIVKLINQIVDDLSSHIDSEKEVSIIFKYTRDNFHIGTESKTLTSEQNTKDKSLIIYADETRITQVIINLEPIPKLSFYR